MRRSHFTLGLVATAALAVAYAPYADSRLQLAAHSASELAPQAGSPDSARLRLAARSAGDLEVLDPRPADDRPVSGAVVLDLSCSMSAPHKARRAQQVATHLASQLGADDRFAIVGFRDHADVILPTSEAVYPLQVQQRLQNLYPGGGSNLHAGLVRGADEVFRGRAADGAGRIVVITDGPPNTGVVSEEGLVRLAAQLSAGGIEVSVLNLEAARYDPLLHQVAIAGEGRYASLDED